MKVLQIVVPILGLVLLLAACDSDPMLDALLDNIEAGSTDDRIISDGSVDSEILAEVKDSMDLSRAYAKEHLGIDPPGCNVFMSTDAEWMTDRYEEAFKISLTGANRLVKVKDFTGCGGEGGFQNIFFSVCDDWWKMPLERRERGYAHEWWHTNVQYYLLNAICCSDNYRMQMVGPHWLMEGSAGVWESLVLNDFANLVFYPSKFAVFSVLNKIHKPL